MEQKEIQEQYMQLQMLDQQIKSAQKQVQMLDQQLEEMTAVLLALDDVKKTNKGDNILVPLSSGIYIKAKLDDTSNFIVNIGAQVAVSKNIEGTKKLVESQIKEISGVQQQMVSDVKEMVKDAKNLQMVIQEALSKGE